MKQAESHAETLVFLVVYDKDKVHTIQHNTTGVCSSLTDARVVNMTPPHLIKAKYSPTRD